MSSRWCILLLTTPFFVQFAESLVKQTDLIKSRFNMYNHSPKPVYVYKVRHTIVHDMWEEYHDIYRHFTIQPNETTDDHQMHIRHSEDSMEGWLDLWVMLYHYDNKNYTTEKPFWCRVLKEDAQAPIRVIVDFYEYRIHVVPPVSPNCSITIHYVPDPDYDYNDYPLARWVLTNTTDDGRVTITEPPWH